MKSIESAMERYSNRIEEMVQRKQSESSTEKIYMSVQTLPLTVQAIEPGDRKRKEIVDKINSVSLEK